MVSHRKNGTQLLGSVNGPIARQNCLPKNPTKTTLQLCISRPPARRRTLLTDVDKDTLTEGGTHNVHYKLRQSNFPVGPM